MATEEENQAKQLDSVTDHMEEQEVDLTKAQQAISALGAGGKASAASGDAQALVVSREDVQIICDELEVTEEVATRTLQEVARDKNAGGAASKEGVSLVSAALRKLITT